MPRKNVDGFRLKVENRNLMSLYAAFNTIERYGDVLGQLLTIFIE